jgi:putative SOS response-associated peptidase YedK
MCGRYTVTSSGETIADLFDLAEVPQLPLRYNLAPTQEAPVVRVASPGGLREVALLRWGLIPYWAKEAGIGNKMINARAESVAEKPAYKFSFKKKRCLVVADGFYEWKKEGKGKQPYLIRRSDRQPFAFAGLWSTWRDPQAQGSASPGEKPEPVETFTILTTVANEILKPLHDRMPVIVRREDFDLWLDPQVEDAARLTPLLAPAPVEGWETVPVSRAVNSPAHDAPDCIESLVE